MYQFYRDAFLSGRVERRQNLYQEDQLDGYYDLVAQRCDDLLVVHFTDGNDQPRTAVEEALRASQARERAARAEIEAQQATLRHTFEQVPVALSILEGPDHVVTFANEGMRLLWGRPLATVVGRPHFDALPDLQGQGFEAIFADAYHRGQSFYLHEQLVQIDRLGMGQLVAGYFNISYQPIYNGQQRITGIVASAIDVTEQVQGRQQVQQLNQELEQRVTARSADLQEALHEAEDQREQLRTQRALLDQVLRQMPAAIATVTGSEHRYSFFNAPYQAFSAQRTALGRSVAEVFPRWSSRALSTCSTGARHGRARRGGRKPASAPRPGHRPGRAPVPRLCVPAAARGAPPAAEYSGVHAGRNRAGAGPPGARSPATLGRNHL